MPVQVTTRGPVQLREYEPDRAAGNTAQAPVITRVKVIERGPDVQIEVYVREFRAGGFTIPREAEMEMVQRLFGEVPERREDRAAFQVTLQGFEDAILSQDPARVVAAWRRSFEVYDTMARDIASLAGLPNNTRGAA